MKGRSHTSHVKPTRRCLIPLSPKPYHIQHPIPLQLNILHQKYHITLCKPHSAQDSQGRHRHGPGSCHVQTIYVNQGQQQPSLKDASQPNLPCLQMAQEPRHQMSMSDRTYKSGRHCGLTINSHAQRGEGGGVEFSPCGPLGTTEPPTLSSCLRMDSNCKDLYPDIPHSFPDPNVCPTTKCLGPTPWVLDSGEKQLDHIPPLQSLVTPHFP